MANWKILIADDDPDDRMIIDDALQEINASGVACFVENGEQALKKLDENHRSGNIPCLIVLDLNMPRMNGTEILRSLKNDERYKNIPVIIYSTSINLLEQEKCMLLGAHSYITKPISLGESIQTAETFIGFCALAPR